MTTKAQVVVETTDGEVVTQTRADLPASIVLIDTVPLIAFDSGTVILKCSDDAAKVGRISVDSSGVMSVQIVTPDA